MNHSTENILVSIAVATYNGTDHLKEQLDSLLQQTYPFIEIIISDDGSTDQTIEIIKSYQKEHSNIFLFINEGGKGIKQNFENALKHCKGNYIALCDQDDYWLPEKIEKLLNGIADHDLVYHNSLFVNEEGLSLNKSLADKMNCYSGNNPEVFLLHNCISGHAVLFNKNILTDVLPFPEARYHDWWLAFIAAGKAGVIYLPEILVHYRQHKSSKTDILKRKAGFKHQKEFIKYQEELEWFTQCAKVKNRQQEFFSQWLQYYRQRPAQWFSPGLFVMALRKRAALYAIPKKGSFGKFILALKLFWGLKTKKIIG